MHGTVVSVSSEAVLVGARAHSRILSRMFQPKKLRKITTIAKTTKHNTQWVDMFAESYSQLHPRSLFSRPVSLRKPPPPPPSLTSRSLATHWSDVSISYAGGIRRSGPRCAGASRSRSSLPRAANRCADQVTGERERLCGNGHIFAADTRMYAVWIQRRDLRNSETSLVR